MNNKPYKRIACNFYDILESHALYKTKLHITFINEQGNTEETLTTILTFQTKNKAEYAHLANGKIIRLDHIISTVARQDI